MVTPGGHFGREEIHLRAVTSIAGLYLRSTVETREEHSTVDQSLQPEKVPDQKSTVL